MAFPIGFSMIGQPRLRKVEMQEYALHLICYYDNRFDQHQTFQYYLYNLMLWHCSQATVVVFMKINLEESFLMTVADFHARLHDMPDSMLPDQIMCFGLGLRGKCSF